MVRTDINNFSTIYNNHSVDDFMRVINEYFTDVSHIVARYKGLIHEFLGDEVIFYFKDEDCLNSVETALSAIRDVNAAAERVQERTMKKYGYPFTVKSALAHGTIRFGPLVNGYSLAGSVLIESVRILSHVVEKEGNVACFEGANLNRLKDVTIAEDYARVNLKGFSGTKTLYRYVGHTPLADLLAQLSDESVAWLTYYRSDESLAQILRHLHEQQERMEESVILKAIRVLRDVPVTKASEEIAGALLSWLEALSAFDTQGEGKSELRVLSAATMLAMNLIPQEGFTAEIDERLSRLLLVSDRRVVANVLDVLTHFKSGGDPKFVGNLLSHKDNRILANALVHEGHRDISPRVLKALRRMLSGKATDSDSQNAQTASALYAIGEIAAYHRSRDVVYYNAQVEFHAMVERLPEFALNNNVMIRRQAMAAARKIGDPNILNEIIAKIHHSSQPDRLAEAQEHLGVAAFEAAGPPLKKSA
jgi:adenylate cyclase